MIKAKNFSAANFGATRDPGKFKVGLERKKPQEQGYINNILDIAVASRGEYDVNDREAQRIRAQIYWINKNHPRGYRFRTMREGTLLMVWRIQ